MSDKWHNKYGARVIKPKHFSYNKRADDWMKPFDDIKQTPYEESDDIDCPPKPFDETAQKIVVGEHPTQHDESDDIEAAKTIRQEREEKRKELLHKIKTYSEEDKYN